MRTFALLASCGALVGCAVDEIPGIDLPSGKADETAMTSPEACPGGAPRLVDGAPATWTVLHYAAADNNLEDLIVEDINEMERGHRGSNDVNVVVQLDRASQPGAWRYRITPDADSRIRSDLVGHTDEEPDSGNFQTLIAFADWAITCYPADNYAVIIGGHGNGWSHRQRPEVRAARERARAAGDALRLIAPDDTNQSEIYVNELADALARIRARTRRMGDPTWLNRLAMYGSDACLMQTMEVAYELRDMPMYVLGSEETEPGMGWPYNTVIGDLTARPYRYAQQPHLLADAIVRNYRDSYAPDGLGEGSRTTMAAVDTGFLDGAREAVDAIAGLLVGLMASNAALTPIVREVRGRTFAFGDSYADLGMFLAELRRTLIERGLMPAPGEDLGSRDRRYLDLRGAIDNLLAEILPRMIFSSSVGEAFPGARGLSIYFPQSKCAWSHDLGTYLAGPFGASTRWGWFIQQITAAPAPPPPMPTDDLSGKGTATLAVRDQTTDGHAIWCDLRAGTIQIYGSSEDPWVFSLSGTVGANEIRFVAAYLNHSEAPELDVWTSLDDNAMGYPVVDLHMTPGVSYAGAVTLPMKSWEDEGAAPIEVTVRFECGEFAPTFTSSGECW